MFTNADWSVCRVKHVSVVVIGQSMTGVDALQACQIRALLFPVNKLSAASILCPSKFLLLFFFSVE